MLIVPSLKVLFEIRSSCFTCSIIFAQEWNKKEGLEDVNEELPKFLRPQTSSRNHLTPYWPLYETIVPKTLTWGSRTLTHFIEPLIAHETPSNPKQDLWPLNPLQETLDSSSTPLCDHCFFIHHIIRPFISQWTPN